MDYESKQKQQQKKTLVQFLPFSTLIDPTFWFEIKRIKLDELKLEIKQLDICPSFSIRNTTAGLITLNYECFNSYQSLCERREKNPDNDSFYLNGKLIIYNTKEEFESVDKRVLVNDQGKFIWKAINNESQQEQVDSNLEFYLARFFMIIYGDLKTYDFSYWCAYPSLSFPPNCFQVFPDDSDWTKYFNSKQMTILLQSQREIPMKQRLFFVILLKPLINNTSEQNNENKTYFEDYQPEIVLFNKFWSLNYIENLITLGNIKIIFAFSDFSLYPNYPGWLLRNFLSYLHVRLSQLLKHHRNNPNVLWLIRTILFSNHLTIASISIPRFYTTMSLDELKPSMLKTISKRSFIHHIALLPSNYRKILPDSYLDGFIKDVDKLYASLDSIDSTSLSKEYFIPPAVGWERNKKLNNRLVPNQVNCANMLNPELIATDALYLNLKLMKWRLVPNLDLEKIKNTRCLLLGAGTLGCNVARALVAWGINHITMVDNKNVSYSNPVRQSLYTYQDAISGLQSKAKTAAESLRLINPSIKSYGINLNIKMPGHLFEKALKDEMEEIERLEQLIDKNDVIILMTDTRESRWLPTLIATAKHKIIINIALGFDTFLVQRFGIRFRPNDPINEQCKYYPLYQKQQKIYDQLFSDDFPSKVDSPILLGTELGCYFCNDVFAPSNSTKDRTLDQQCTVTRPGLSMIASGYAAELLISILQHPAGPLAPSMNGSNNDFNIKQQLSKLHDSQYSEYDYELLNVESLLGVIPHEFRGFLSYFQHMTPTTPRLEYCIACSFAVIDNYRNDKENFLYMAINDSKSLEKMTGINVFHDYDSKVFALDDDSQFIDLKD